MSARYSILRPYAKRSAPALGERQISAGRVQREPAVRDGGFDGQAILLMIATGLSELLINVGDRQATGVIGLDCIRFLLGGLRRRKLARPTRCSGGGHLLQ
jgi:hypothetical protein